MRSSWMVLITCLCIVLFSLPSNAQDSVKELAAKASGELRLLNSLQTLEWMTSQINHFMVYSIEAERGGWRVMEKEVGNDYAIRSNAARVQEEAARASSSIQKSKVATEGELEGAETAVQNLNVLLALAPQIADLISAKEFDQAATLYKENGQSAHDNAIRGAQSSMTTVQKRLGKTLLDLRIAE